MRGKEVEPSAEIEVDGRWEAAEPDDSPRTSVWDSSWRGARRWVRWVTFLAGPAVLIMLVPGLALLHFGLGTGHGFFALPDLVINAIAFYGVVTVAGGFIGVVLGVHEVYRARRGKVAEGPAWWQSLNRPVHLSRRVEPGDGPHPVAPPSSGRPSFFQSALAGAIAGFRWALLILVTTLWAVAAVLVTLGNLGLGSVVHMNLASIGSLPSVVALGLGLPIVSAAYAIALGAPIGLVLGVLGWLFRRMSRRSTGPGEGRRFRLFGRNEKRPRETATVLSGLRRRWPYAIGLSLQLLMVGSLALGAYTAWWVQRRFEVARDVAGLDDPNWRLDDLMEHRQSVPYGENSAFVMEEVNALLPQTWPPNVPPVGQKGNPADRIAAEAIDRLNAMDSNIGLDESTAEAIRGELERYREAVHIARTLMYYDRGRHELEIGPKIIDTLLPETQAARNVARLLCADAKMRAHDGDIDGSLDSCRASLCAGRSIGDEPYMISQLVRMAIGSVSVQALFRILGQGEASDLALATLQALILDEKDQPLLFYAVRGERAAMDELIRRIAEGEIPISALSNERWKPDGSGSRDSISPWARVSFDYQRALELEWLDDAVSIAESPPWERLERWKAWDQRILAVKDQWHSSVTSVLPMLMTPSLKSGGWAHARCQAELGATAILLAAERHRLRTGSWPKSVDAIDESILPDPPFDPFTGESYRMEHRDGRLFVYSVGPNLRDEHGDYNPRKWMAGNDQDDVGAIGWDLDRRHERPSLEEEDPNASPGSP